MKKIALLFLVLLLIFPLASSADHKIVLAYPEELQISMVEETWSQERFETTVDIPITCSEKINAELRSALYDLWQQAVETAENDAENCQIEIGCTFRISGQSWAGFLMTARITHSFLSEHHSYSYDETQWMNYLVKSYDMKSETEITLSDVFLQDSEEWVTLSECITDFLHEEYAELSHDEKTIAALTESASLSQLQFLPCAGRFLLSFPLWDIVSEKYQIAQFSLFYSDCKSCMTEEALLQTDNSQRPVIALTYDDGPSYSLTKSLLRSLNCNGATATFFPIGQQIAKWSDLVRQELDFGHSVGCHSMHHLYDYKYNGGDGLFADKEECCEQHKTLLGIAPKLFRAPGGSERKYLTYKVGWTLIHWNQTAGDTGNGKPAYIAKRISGQAQDGDIILMHDIHKGSVTSADTYMSELYERGFMFATVEEMLSMKGVSLEPNRIYSNGFGPDTAREDLLLSK